MTGADDDTDTPTVSEFIPAEEHNRHHDKNVKRTLRLTDDKERLVLVDEEEHELLVPEYVLICDVCDHAEGNTTDMAAHLRSEHMAREPSDAERVRVAIDPELAEQLMLLSESFGYEPNEILDELVRYGLEHHQKALTEENTENNQ